MKTKTSFGVAAALWMTMGWQALAVAPSPQEMAEARKWAAAKFEGGETLFSFTYNGRPSAELLRTWKLERTSRQLDDQRMQRTTTYTDPKTGLEVRCTSVEYADFPAVEWTVYFRNTGAQNTPILQGIQAIDVGFQKSPGAEFALHGIRGDACSPDSYAPWEQTLGPNTTKTFAAVQGRPTQTTFPCYNLAMPGGGLIAAVGWPGQWAATFARDAGNGLRITAGQELTHLYLKPGEEIRTPLMVLLFWKGSDPVRAQNLWRRWMFAHNFPRLNGKPLRPLYWFCDTAYSEGFKTSETGEKQFIDLFSKENIRLDYWWIDAGWYPCGGDWTGVGTWEPEAKRYPHGLKAVSDYVHARGMGLIVWFEPERVMPHTWLTDNHPEWISFGKNGGLLDLGNRDAWKWLANHIDKLLTEQGIDLYRQDFNVDPLVHWRADEAKDRQGITENLHVQGYLAFWDELRRRHPGMLIDSCASGGRRNDLETIRRAVPLLRSDYQWGGAEIAPGNQGHTYGLSSWIPYYGQGVYVPPQRSLCLYLIRSMMCPGFCICADVRKPGFDWDLYRRMVDQWREVAGCFLGDYYPLTPYSLGDDRWIAWQFDRPEQGDGMIQAFRRKDSIYEAIRTKLHGLDPNGVYTIKNVDLAGTTEQSGRELMESGLPIVIKDQPGAVIIKYQKKP